MRKNTFVDRGNRFAHAGCVRWPRDRSVCEMGCAVVAIVREGEFDHDPFVRSLASGRIVLTYNDPVLTPAAQRALWPHLEEPDEGRTPEEIAERYLSVTLLAAVTLGTCGAGFADWHPTRDDLTEEGVALVTALEALCARPVEILLFVDT